MTTNDVLAEIRESLNGRPGQPIVFGVCRSLAERFGQEPWVYRAAAILLALFWPQQPLAVAAGVLVMAIGPMKAPSSSIRMVPVISPTPLSAW